ncbi:MAG: trypsin-like peptidase domain-containing protein [Steroidobacteraceae bacterium]
MKPLSSGLLIAAFHLAQVLAASNAATAATPAAAPTFPDAFAGEPEFNTTGGRGSAGSAGVVKLKDGTSSYIVSARHLLGPEGAFDGQGAAKDVAAFVKSIRITSFFSGSARNYHVAGLLVPATRLETHSSEPLDDLTIYLIKDHLAQGPVVPLADRVPAQRTQIWLVATVRGGVPDGQIMQSGRVASNGAWPKWLIFQFDNDRIVPGGASGAPVVNAAGEVVGVYSGHRTEQGHVLGFAIPAPLIATAIRTASAPSSGR